MKNCIPWETPHAGAEQCEDEGAADTKCYEVTTTPIPHLPVLLPGEEVEEPGVKSRLGREWGKVVVMVVLFVRFGLVWFVFFSCFCFCFCFLQQHYISDSYSICSN